MTAGKVVDASALAAFCFDEPELPAIAQSLEHGPLFAPALLDFELANICWKRLRRAPENSDAILRQFAIRQDFAIDIRLVDQTAVVALAVSTGLTAYDASYLWLARHLGVELVTLDRKLAAAAEAVA